LEPFHEDLSVKDFIMRLLWISNNKENLANIGEDKVRIINRLTPDEARYLYNNLIGIEDENYKTLAETFDLVEEEDGEIRFYCKKCSTQTIIPEIE